MLLQQKRKAALYLELALYFRMLRTNRSPRRGDIFITPDKAAQRMQWGRDSGCKAGVSKTRYSVYREVAYLRHADQ